MQPAVNMLAGPFRFKRLCEGAVIDLVLAVLLLPGDSVCADSIPVETVGLPALRIEGKPVRAHTQGPEISKRQYYLSARLESAQPKRAVLARFAEGNRDWDVFDVGPSFPNRPAVSLDHPGGMQFDGKLLWIPIAQSKPKSSSVVCAFPLENFVAGRPVKCEIEFAVDDHIGAIAVNAERGLVFGANWDTECVYIWNFQGQLKDKLSGSALSSRRLGLAASFQDGPGIAVQDWKSSGDVLYASGLARSTGDSTPRSRLLQIKQFLGSDELVRSIALPRHQGVELSREAMAVFGEWIYFVPEDLGESNRLFRISLSEVEKRLK